MADYHQEHQQRLNQRIDEAFPSVGTTQSAHEGSQSIAPNALTTPSELSKATIPYTQRKDTGDYEPSEYSRGK